MDRASEQLLASSRFALKKHRSARRRCHAHRLQRVPNGRRVADDPSLVAELHHFAAKRVVLAPQPDEFKRLIDRQLKLLRTHRLGDVVDRPRLDRRHRMLDARIAGEHDQRNVHSVATQKLEKLQAGESRHSVVRYDEVDAALGQYLEGLRHVRHGDRLVSGSLERVLEDQPDRRIVIDAEYRGHLGKWRGEDCGRDSVAGRQDRLPSPGAQPFRVPCRYH